MRKNTFATVLLRDGLIYFVSLLMLNSLHLILTMLSESNIPSLQDASFVSLFAVPLTTILVSRFLLHLQSAKHKSTDVYDTAFGMTSSRSTSIIFDRVIGSLDQSLSVDDFLGPVESNDDVDIAPKDSSKECGARGGDPHWGNCESLMSKGGYEVFELPVRSPSIGNEEA
uniref:Dual O-methyltransferase/FAD-dependent monooxygenase CTB3 (Cercosporin toxin biosynthesis cluster protein 3) n=1 Tax=Ganoderma boninense TaxID=34458 RepID=A0A5K1K2B9_9APHY|nr:Dual O-methyltransferase/FAD-dependent monooxygenase CTB3 (Cercosporin toxin biosynthesis cluster protein 3) [Includes: O-methyltransferase (EC, FAD-dependent monooxygenase (EC ] [Ganoderma boninense]